MPKKKASGAFQPKVDVSGQAAEDLEKMKLEDDKIQKMKEQLIAQKPEFKLAFDHMEHCSTGRIEQAQNSSVVFASKRGKVTPDLVNQFPNSPTAKRTVEAYNHYQIGCQILWSYALQKARILTDNDCSQTQPGFHHYMEGYMIASYLSKQFPLPNSVYDGEMVEDYLKLKPNDSLVEYFHVSIVVTVRAREKSDYERCKDMIRAREILANKLLPYKTVETEKRILIDSFFTLGARYYSTDQYERALEAFEKCYALDKTNVAALYAVAFQYKDDDPENALKLCNKYLDMAPKCDEKYPNTCYLIGSIYALRYHNIQQARKYYELGLNSERYQLPFNLPVEFEPKSFLESLIPIDDKNQQRTQRSLKHLDLD